METTGTQFPLPRFRSPGVAQGPAGLERRPPVLAGRGPVNHRAPGTLAARRVKFFGWHRREVNFSANDQMLITASEDGCVYGWKTQNGHQLWRLGGHTGPVKSCRFSPDGHFASTSCDCTIHLWDVAEAKCLQILKGHQRSVETVSFSPDSKKLASGGWDKRVMLWEVQSGQMLHNLVGHRDSVRSSDFAPSSDCLATGSWDSIIRIWDRRTGTPAISHQELEGHSGNIRPAGIWLLGQDHPHLEALNPKPACAAQGHATWVKSIAFSPDRLQLASTGYCRMVKAWDCNTGRCIKTLKGALDMAHSCAFTPDGKLLVSGAAV